VGAQRHGIVERIVSNLLRNAIEYAPASRVSAGWTAPMASAGWR
jgi:hypothetical protein